ncbi:helix-turn-helix domain-containing protein [Paenibacillus azoreducens]|uniref:HTH araC/xylS-type domain-containing protein n=1 Tax=Paenibacillus azoreducens TaxID=116718 RepID=A0A920CQ55_9BACL|nr:AraC family transcriptional regulator [Paenibacillus azoreducens]GIO49421.1 hypothetical protein J34TS1_41860 [Paenibacillus azoreducens]
MNFKQEHTRTWMPSPVLHEQSAEYYWKGTGKLSVKTFRGGSALYQAGNGHYSVGDNRYLLLNQGQEYSIAIESDQPVESFCVFFPHGMPEEVWRSCVRREEELLDDPFNAGGREIEFVAKTYGIGPEFSQILEQMRMDSANGIYDPAGIEEQLHELMCVLFREHRQVRHEMSKLPTVKSSTSEELYRRVYIGYEYLSAYYHRSVTVSEAAKAACLSTNHFLRGFKQLFGFTPHQLLKEKRLQEAKKLLCQTDWPVTDICLAVGFQSHGSFSSLFARRFGVSPSVCRGKR